MGNPPNKAPVKFADLSAADQSAVEAHFHVLAEINRQRAKAVDAHMDLVRRGLVDFRAVAVGW